MFEEKKIPPEMVAASPIHRRHHPAGQSNIRVPSSLEQTTLSDFATYADWAVGFLDIYGRLHSHSYR